MDQVKGDEVEILSDFNLFELKCLVKVSSVRLSARCEVGRRQLIAFVMGSGDLCLHYTSEAEEEDCKPVMRRIPWHVDSCRAITTMCFDSSGSWLLVAGYDTTLFIVPALALVDSGLANDHRWSTTDTTVLPPPAPPPSTSSGSSNSSSLGSPITHQQNHPSRPTAIVWWQSLMECHHTAIIGTENGAIMFVSLARGTVVGMTYVRDSITRLHLCQDNSLDSVFLLITCANHSQWKLLLEERKIGYSWPLDASASISKTLSSDQQPILTLGDGEGGGRGIPRSRLQGLKQLSVEKLASIRHKLAETRSRGLAVVQQARRESSSSGSDETAVSQTAKSSTVTTSDTFPMITTTGPLPVSLSTQVGETLLCPQYARGRYLLSGYYAPSSILTVGGMPQLIQD